jgi:alkylation response protein AidB-like acyl-CoA dehydrogenase
MLRNDSMDLHPTPQQEELRSSIRSWLRANLPWEYGTGLPPMFDDLSEEVAFLRDWQSRLAAAGWVGVTWPVEYGGRGSGPAENFVVQEELARARAPELVGRIGINLAGPTLLEHGTPEQKLRFLPPILRAEKLWCQLFSEPDAGSDLASVRTRASEIDGGWVLNGTKVWTSYAQFADWGICLARTGSVEEANRGLSFFVVDMHDPGVDVRPLRQLTGESEFNEVVLEEVFVPSDQLVGAVGQGWKVAGSTLSRERGVNPRQLVIHLQHLDELLREAARDGSFDDPGLSRLLAQSYVEVRLFQLLNWRSLSKLERGLEPGPEGSVLKLYWSEMSKRMHSVALDVLGDASPLWRGASSNPGDGSWQRSWLYYQASSIFAGTNEIQRTVIGERVLGLPREPSGAERNAARAAATPGTKE